MRNSKAASSAGNAFRIVKLCVMGISMVSVPLFVKPAFVGTYGFLSVTIPRVREMLSAWLTPTFLYVMLNCIIVAIVANSGVGIFSSPGAGSHRPEGFSPSPHQQEKEEKPKPIVREETKFLMEERSETVVGENSEEKSFPLVERSETKVEATSADFAAADTLEATWEAITEARRLPPTRQLRKADTWQTRCPPENVFPRFGKSETWNSGKNLDRKTVGEEMLRKEPSLGQDELNKRVEAFIAKVNHDMKLQREESLLHYKEMVNRGSG